MGTRNVIAVFMDGKYKVAQYSQWDGYPEGQGMSVLKFLKEEFVEHKFRTNLKNLKMVSTYEEREALNTLYRDNLPPEFDRDTGSNILKLIQNGEVKSGFLINRIGFVSQGDCEWVWLIDLNTRTFEAYKGWNEEPLNPFDRFYFLGNYQDGDYCPAKCVHKWLLSDLPSEKDFLSAFEKDEEV